MTTLKPGDKVMVVKNLTTSEYDDMCLLKTGTVRHTQYEDCDGFIVSLKEFPDFRFHPDELQLIEGSHD